MGCGYYRNVTIERQQRHAIATAPGRVVDVAVYRPCAAPANFYAFEYISAWILLARTKGGKITKRIHLLVFYPLSCCETFFPSFSMDAFVPRYAHREEGRKRIAEEVIDAMKIISMETELRTD